MIDRRTFDEILTKLYDGFGRAIKESQLSTMYHRLSHYHEDQIRTTARWWIDNEAKPPLVKDFNDRLGGGKSGGAKMFACADCAGEFEYVYRVGNDDRAKNCCIDCWEKVARKCKVLQPYHM